MLHQPAFHTVLIHIDEVSHLTQDNTLAAFPSDFVVVSLVRNIAALYFQHYHLWSIIVNIQGLYADTEVRRPARRQRFRSSQSEGYSLTPHAEVILLV